jgi:hypothetical protein
MKISEYHSVMFYISDGTVYDDTDNYSSKCL